MNLEQLLHQFEPRIAASLQADATATLLTDCVAVPVRDLEAWEVLESLDEEYSICRVQPQRDVQENQLTKILPCYDFGSTDTVVATGDAFVRFAEHDAVGQHLTDLEQAGFVPRDGSSEQSFHAWLTPATGRPADGIRSFSKLADVSAMVRAERELRRPKSWRSGGGLPGPPPS